MRLLGRRYPWQPNSRKVTQTRFASTGWPLHLSCGGNKLDTCPLNNLNFIIHATACNPFVWRAAGSIIRCRVSNTARPLYWISLQPIFHLLGEKRKTHCLIPPYPAPAIATSHHAFLLSHDRKNDRLVRHPGHIQRGRWIFNVRKANLPRWGLE